MPKVIDSFRGEYFFLSNFYLRPINFRDHSYKSSEHAFQAAKATNEEDRQYIEDAAGAREAQRRGRRIKCRDDWNDVRMGEMCKIVYLKFAQNLDLEDKLLATGDAVLIEGNWWGDTYWGMVKDSDGNWRGENYLGRILTEVRKVFKDTKKMEGD